MATADRTSSHDDNAVVVLVDCAGGRELAVVHDVLVHALDTPAVLIDPASTAISLDVDTGLLTVDGRAVRPAVTWIRHSSVYALKALDAAAWSGLLAQVAATATAALPGTAPAAPGQLADAGRLGVAAPRTVVTSDVAAGVRELGTSRAIVKTPDFRLFEPDRLAWPEYLPAVVDRETAPAGPGRPVVVQEYVAHSRELRVYYLDGGVCAFEVAKPDPASFWTDPGSVTVARVDCPERATTTVRTLCAAWNLRYAAFDLLVAASGEPVFLEANPDGDWLWFEGRARWSGVSFMAAVMVRDLFVRSTSWGASAQ
jgi:hypothetical protein